MPLSEVLKTRRSTEEDAGPPSDDDEEDSPEKRLRNRHMETQVTPNPFMQSFMQNLQTPEPPKATRSNTGKVQGGEAPLQRNAVVSGALGGQDAGKDETQVLVQTKSPAQPSKPAARREAKTPDVRETRTTEIKPSEAKPTPSAGPAAAPAAPFVASKTDPSLQLRPDDSPGGVVVFFSCKGGAGATSLAVNTANSYVRQKQPTCILDLDLQLGDALAALGMQPKYTIGQAVGAQKKGEGVHPRAFTRHASGIAVLSQVGSLDDLDKINAEALSNLVGQLRAHFGMVVVDGVRDFSDNVLAVLDAADKIAIVTVQEILAIRRSRWAYHILRKIGFETSDIMVVVNRCAVVSEIPVATIKKMFEPSTVLIIPADEKVVTDSLNRGVPLAETQPMHTVTRHIDYMSNVLLGRENIQPLAEVKTTWVDRLMFWRRT